MYLIPVPMFSWSLKPPLPRRKVRKIGRALSRSTSTNASTEHRATTSLSPMGLPLSLSHVPLWWKNRHESAANAKEDPCFFRCISAVRTPTTEARCMRTFCCFEFDEEHIFDDEELICAQGTPLTARISSPRHTPA